MAKIAVEAGVSVATVSRAMGPEAVKLNEKTAVSYTHLTLPTKA